MTTDPRMPSTDNLALPGWIGDVSGAFADLGTFLPLVIGLLLLTEVDPSGLLVGFGLAAVATGLIYRLPVPVQPMKAVAALALAGGLGAAAMTASGLLIGAALVVLGLTGLIGRIERLVPRTVLFGIQLGLGLQLVGASAALAGDELWLGLAALAALALLQATPIRSTGCLLLLVGAVIWSLAMGGAEPPALAIGWHLPQLAVVDLRAVQDALETAVLPQLALTVTNAVLLTAALASDYFPRECQRVSVRRLAFSSGALNLLLAPFGAVPMCHGAGGLAAQYHQGARSGLAPAIFGAACLLLGLLAGPQALDWLRLVPMPLVAALLAYAGFQLADARRLAQVSKPCLAIIGLTALASLLATVAVGLLVGLALELMRTRLAGLRQPSV